MKVRSAIQEIKLEHRKRYGYRRITAELRRRGLAVNHKRVARMMQADNLLAIRNCEWLAGEETRKAVTREQANDHTCHDNGTLLLSVA
jgi:putative transposase